VILCKLRNLRENYRFTTVEGVRLSPWLTLKTIWFLGSTMDST